MFRELIFTSDQTYSGVVIIATEDVVAWSLYHVSIAFHPVYDQEDPSDDPDDDDNDIVASPGEPTYFTHYRFAMDQRPLMSVKNTGSP